MTWRSASPFVEGDHFTGLSFKRGGAHLWSITLIDDAAGHLLP